jgi:hypothetical protein
MKKSDIISAPALDHDAMMLREYKCGVGDIGRKDRLVVANLIAHMERRGWHLHSVYDGEETTRVATAKEAMELVFNLDEASLRFDKGSRETRHGAALVMGNSGYDVVSDWSYAVGDTDGFSADMDAFDAEAVLEAYDVMARDTVALVSRMATVLASLADAVEALDGTSVENERIVDAYRKLMADLRDALRSSGYCVNDASAQIMRERLLERTWDAGSIEEIRSVCAEIIERMSLASFGTHS